MKSRAVSDTPSVCVLLGMGNERVLANVADDSHLKRDVFLAIFKEIILNNKVNVH